MPSPEGGMVGFEDTPTMLRKQISLSSPSSPTPTVGSKAWLKARGPVIVAGMVIVTFVGAATMHGTGVTRTVAASPVTSAPSLHRLHSRELEAQTVQRKTNEEVPSMAALKTLGGGYARLSNEVSALRHELTDLKQQSSSELATLRKEVAALSQHTHAQPSLGATAQLAAALPTVEPLLPPPSHVLVWFVFDASAHLGASVDVFWIAANQTERRYANVPAGQRVQETTEPGQCWRVKTTAKLSSLLHGQTLVTYCATAEPRQYVHVVPKEQVDLTFHYPMGASAMRSMGASAMKNALAATANVYHARVLGHGLPLEQLVGTLKQGETLHVPRVRAGGRYIAREGMGAASPSRKVLLDVAVGYEAEQHYDLVAANRTIELALAPDTAPDAAVHVFYADDETDKQASTIGREHFFAELTAASPSVQMTSAAGERWLVRRRSETYEPGETLLELAVRDEDAVQRHLIVVPPIAPKK